MTDEKKSLGLRGLTTAIVIVSSTKKGYEDDDVFIFSLLTSLEIWAAINYHARNNPVPSWAKNESKAHSIGILSAMVGGR